MKRRRFVVYFLAVVLSPFIKKTLSKIEFNTFREKSGESPIPEKIDNVIETEKRGNLVLIKNNTRSIELNRTGSFIWKRIQGRNSTRKISLDFSREFGIETEKALTDVELFFRGLQREGFVLLNKKERFVNKFIALKKEKIVRC